MSRVEHLQANARLVSVPPATVDEFTKLFARGEGAESPVDTDIALLIEDLAVASRREGTPLVVDQPAELVLPVRP